MPVILGNPVKKEGLVKGKKILDKLNMKYRIVPGETPGADCSTTNTGHLIIMA